MRAMHYVLADIFFFNYLAGKIDKIINQNFVCSVFSFFFYLSYSFFLFQIFFSAFLFIFESVMLNKFPAFSFDVYFHFIGFNSQTFNVEVSFIEM